ncbi:MAG: lysylphosphatidylglycerol synthase transmembrane domain-containing protein [Pseudomonadota bacterium]
MQILGFFVLVGLALSLVDVRGVWDHARNLSAPTLIAAVGLHIAIVVLAAWRFALLVRSFNVPLRIGEANRLTFGSTLANLCLPTSLAGDAARVALVRRHGLTWRAAVSVGIFDRMIGLLALCALAAYGTIFADAAIPRVVVIGCLVIALVSTLGAVRLSRSAILSTRLSIQTFALSMGGHLISIVIAAILLSDLGVEVEIGVLAALFPAILLAASLPISIGGWGTRELAATAAFSTIGMEPSVAVAMAFLFGATQLAAAALGTGVALVLGRKDRL